jgi:hypothetical protein
MAPAQHQHPDLVVDDTHPVEAEEERSQTEAQDDVALLVGFPSSSGDTVIG